MSGIEIFLESAVVLYLIKEGVSYAKERRKKKAEKNPFQKAFVDISKLYAELNALLVDVKGDRVVLLRSHNGGGKPKIGSPLYSSAEYEVFQGGSQSIKGNWQNQPLDQHYIKMLKELDEQGSLELRMVSMDSESMLKKMYFNSKILCSKVIKIHETKDSFFYISINYGRNVDFLDMNFDELARPYLVRIKQLFKDGEK